MGKGNISRRAFLRGAGKAAVAGIALAHAPAAWGRTSLVGPNDKVRIALLGCGGMGTRHLEALSVNPNCTVAAICDPFTPRYEAGQAMHEKLAGVKPDGYQDFRRVLERDDIDAIFCPTPDHWHPLLTILGCEAGKDVYVEKPACPTVAEGRAMVEAARRYGRVVQLGTQQRSMPIFQQAIAVVRGGGIGEVTSATCWIGVNDRWGVGEHPENPPEGLDWNLWLGPAPYVPYSKERHFGFMGWHDYARGGQLTNWGVHLMDILHWGIGQDRPLTIQATGGNFRGGAGGENFENIEAIFEYPGCNVTWEQRHSIQYQENRGYGIKFNGTKGQLLVDRGSYQVIPDIGIPMVTGEPERSWACPEHHNDFFDAVRTRRRPVADIEQGVRSTAPVLLAGVALKTRRKLNWDGDAEQFINDDEANRYLARTYRAPWHL
ncbi:MAG: Gfo/Idh/MocA family oxidoreductase [FCB group bacterium]|nr:Gfo/Idh/MocA family oxidoreductase [FCB group bacterium]